jgi:hypothetical protein
MTVCQNVSTEFPYFFLTSPTGTAVVVTYLTFTVQLSFTTSGVNMATLRITCAHMQAKGVISAKAYQTITTVQWPRSVTAKRVQKD